MKKVPIQSLASSKPQGLSGSRDVSEKGLGFRTGKSFSGPAYHVIFWTRRALSADTLGQWTALLEQYAAERALLGQKGAFGKLADLDRGHELRFNDLIINELHQNQGFRLDDRSVIGIAEAVENCPAIALEAVAVFRNRAEVLFNLGGELGIDALVNEWKAAAEGAEWDQSFHARVVMPGENEAVADKMLSTFDRECVRDGDDAADQALNGDFHHITVLLREAVDMLQPCEGKVIVDATLGGGGHSELLLERGATVWGIDQDPDARRAARARLARFGDRFRVIDGNFRDVAALLAANGIDRIDGLLADLGISSHQVDTADRGFSFREDGPLDMRMNHAEGRSAADIVNHADERELAELFWQYGEERASRQIARAIIRARAEKEIRTTSALASVVESVLPRKGRQHPATRVFQALRIAVNDELGALDDLLDVSVNLLKEGGRFAVITFHSLEDRRVKRFFDHHSRPEIDRKEWPEPRPNPDYVYQLLNKKPLAPSEEELAANPRARSAKLRGVVKIK